jgi:hypothetical protein
MFPPNWDAYSGPNRKKPRTFLEQVADRASETDQARAEPVGFVSDLYNTIRRSLNHDHPAAEAAPAELDMDHILSRVQYRDMLENLFADGDPGAAPELPIITKVYEESFMRQPAAGERACAMGEQCECRFVDRQAPFTAVEFRLPNDPEFRLPSDPDGPQLCVLCSRRATQKMFYDM